MDDIASFDLTEAEYAEAFTSGVVSHAVPDTEDRIKFMYTDGLRVGFIKNNSGKHIHYRDLKEAWSVVSRIERRESI